jgi:peptidoglycan/LPS O-acetylase OafA/YrhL
MDPSRITVANRLYGLAARHVSSLLQDRGGPRSGVAPRHVPALDGLRGVAILLVAAYHFVWQAADHVPGTSLPYRLITRFADLGDRGVDLFFVLSGFLITGALLDAKGSPRYFRNFYARRTLRIFPLYYLFLTALLVVAPLVFPRSDLVRDAGRGQEWVWLYATNIKLALANRWYFCGMAVCGQGIELNHTWSLAVEEHFYLVWPAVVLVCSRKALVRTCLGLTVVSLALRLALRDHHFAMATLTPCRMDTLALGALVAIGIREESATWLLAVGRVPAAIAAALLAVVLAHPGGPAGCSPVVQACTYTLVAVCCTALLVWTLASGEAGRVGRLARGLSHPILRTFGKYSYALYLFHSALRPFLMRLFPADRLAQILRSPALALVAYAVLATLFCRGLAWLSYHGVENHFLRLKVYFSDHPARSRRPEQGLRAARA